MNFQGVERIQEPEEQKECNSAVAGLHLDWNFDSKTWTATFIGGVHIGTSKRFAAHDLTETQRRKMIELCEIGKKSIPKNASERFITLWCQAIVEGKGGEFEKEWGLAFETPKKKTTLP